jgi:molybdenum cofactor cytidylyltransferase
MRFGPVPLAEAEGALLAHSLLLPGRRLGKAHRLTADDIDLAGRNGVETLIIAIPEASEILEGEAATRLGDSVAGRLLRAAAPVHGRVNLIAEADGLLILSPEAVAALNLVDEAMTLGTLPPFARVRRGDVVATIKIIPYAVTQAALDRALAVAGEAALSLSPFRPTMLDLIHTRIDPKADKLIAKAGRVIRARIEPIGGQLSTEQVCDHDAGRLAELLAGTKAGIVLVAGASATVDRRDVVPAAIVAAGGTIERLGMPVDPGNLLCLGRIGARTVIGLPGCARSPKRNGIDLVLERLLAGLPLDSREIALMGVGGLLEEAGERPEPRIRVPAAGRAVATIVLAAGKASRMGFNKLTADLGGKPVIAHVLDAVAVAGLAPPLVVIGHDRDAVHEALLGRDARFVIAADHDQGLSQSLRAGISAVAGDARAALVLLGDMPFVPPALLRHMAEQASEDVILVPRRDGRPGNPVLWGRSWFPRLATLSGDVGAKSLLGELGEHVRFIDCEDDGVRLDVDTKDALDLARMRVNTARPQENQTP